MKPLLAAVLLCAASACATEQRLIEPGAPDSAQPAAMRVLRHLADGEIDAAAALSNAPKHRLEVLRAYRDAVGEEELKRVFTQYLNNQVVAEVALGPRRLLVWRLSEAGERISGQFYVEVNGRFVMDDVASPARSELRRVLEKYRKSED